MFHTLKLPEAVIKLIAHLESCGFEAYVVGGCVRDSLCGMTPHDWDLCTNASPTQICACFADCHTLTTGEKHGTITVIWEHLPYEITTYRVDGDYTDCRRPNTVHFVQELTKDLRRRDFTVNAMAYHPEQGLIDPLGGEADLKAGVLRCVGNAYTRFSEDALRILRGLRFAACYRFIIAPETAQAANDLAPLLQRISVERIITECDKLLLASGEAAAQIFRQFPTIFQVLFPEIIPLFNCEQHHPRHLYSVWEHTLHVLAATPPDLYLRWTALFHDMGKPQTKTTDTDGIDHFHGHGVVSEAMTYQILHRLHADKKRVRIIRTLVRYHDTPIPEDSKSMRRIAAKLGVDMVRALLQFHLADCIGQSPSAYAADQTKLEQANRILDNLLEKQACLRIQDLAIDGRDLLELGVPKGPKIGEILQTLFQMVIAETLENERTLLLKQARKLQ